MAGDVVTETSTVPTEIDTVQFAATFTYNTNAAFATAAVGVDIINSFTSSVDMDKIVLDRTTFTTLSSAVNGPLQAAEFAIVASDALAGGSSADIVYSSATDNLFYN